MQNGIRLVLIAISASIVAGVSPAVIYGLEWLIISVAVVPIVFVFNLALIHIGTNFIRKFKLQAITQLLIIFPLGILGSLSALIIISGGQLNIDGLMKQALLYVAIGLIAAICSWGLYNFGPLRYEEASL